MHRSIASFLLVALIALSVVTMAQMPAPGAPQNPAAGGRGRGRGMMGPPPPVAPQPLLDYANNLIAAINKADAATVNKMVAPDATYLDEDGHAPAVSRWVANFTNPEKPKTVTIKMVANPGTAEHTALGAMTSDTTGWVSFVYAFPETVKDKQITVTGTCSMVLKKAANGDWQAVLIHGALYQKIAGLTQ